MHFIVFSLNGGGQTRFLDFWWDNTKEGGNSQSKVFDLTHE